MERRTVCRTIITGGLGATTAIAGCSSLLGELEVTNIEAASTPFGNVELLVTVENTAFTTRSGELTGQVDIEGGDTYTKSRSIQIQADDTNEYTFEFDIALGESLTGSSYTYDAWIN